MGWLSILFMIIRYLPDAIELIKKIIEIFRKDPTKFSSDEFQEVKEAAKKFHRSRRDDDKRHLHEVLERLRGKAV